MRVHLVDQQQIADDDVVAFLALVREQGVPLMEAAGATFLFCDAGPDLGDEVDVVSVWSFRDFVEWNGIRRNLMFDPRYGEYAAALARLRRRGTRRFYVSGDVVQVSSDDDHGPALRRWEMFSLAAGVPTDARDRLWRAMRDCHEHIPGITRCAVGVNTTGGPIELVWETTYRSVGAYATTYMTHPYHAALLDRFLLPDCPERITTTNALGAGLIGYPVERERPLGTVTLRRLLLLDFEDPDVARVAAAQVDAVDDGWSESILAENTMATRWFDGETDLGVPSAWSHLWDQCFASIEQYDAHRAGRSHAAEIERTLGPTRSAEILYEPKANPEGLG